MRIIFFTFLFSYYCIHAQVPKFDWIITEGNKSDVGFLLVSTDRNKSTLAIINFIQFPYEICSSQFNQNGKYFDIENLVKYDSMGMCLWTHQFTDNSTGVTGDGIFITTDHDDNIIIGGSFFGTLWLDDKNPINSPNDEDAAFIAKLNPNGKLIWHKLLTSTNGKMGNISISGIQTDQNGNIYFSTYHSQSQFFFENLPIEYSSNLGLPKSTLFKLDPNGNLFWFKKFEAYSSIFQNFKINRKQEIVVVGSFGGSKLKVDEMELTNRNLINPDHNHDGVLNVLDQDGHVVFLESLGGQGNDYLLTLEIDKEDNIYVGGTSFLSDEIEIFTGRIKRLKTNREWNNYVAKIKPDFRLDWIFDDQQVFNYFGIYNVILNKNQDLWVSCKLEKDTFYHNNVSYFCTTNSSPDILYLRLDPTGDIRQVFQIRGNGRDYGNWGDWSGGLHPDGGLVISGTFTSDTLYFGDHALPTVARKQIGDQFTSSAFIARISPDGMVGSKDLRNQDGGLISIHPNPGRDLVQIRFDEDLSADGRVEILTTTGTFMKSVLISKGSATTTVDVRDWPAGVYMVKYRDMDGRSSVERVVVE